MPASDMGNFYIRGNIKSNIPDDAGLVQTFQIRAFDGKDWGPYSTFTVTTTSNNINLNHPLSQGIKGFSYDKNIEISLKNDREFNFINSGESYNESVTSPL